MRPNEILDDLERCPTCDRMQMNRLFRGLGGWLVALGFFALWLVDASLSRVLAAVLIEWWGSF
jgi:hypothetical protein